MTTGAPPKPPPKRAPFAALSDPPPATGGLPPPQARAGLPLPGAQPNTGGVRASLSDVEKESLTLQALGLLEEQVNARIIHYKRDLETNAELDAVTAQVVAQLEAMQAAVADDAPAKQDPEAIEAQHVQTVAELLKKVFSSESQFAARLLKPLGRRVAKLFFESELHERSKGDKEKTLHHAEQGVYYVLGRYKHRLRAELEGFDYASEEVREGTLECLAKIERDLQVAFLSRRSPELNRVMTLYASVVSDFLREYLPPRLEVMVKNAIRAAETARRPDSIGYKIRAAAFPAFREQWERVFVEQMVNCCGDELLLRLTRTKTDFREETLRFFSDPHVYSESARVVCDELYDFLYLEGFLDLPPSWRVAAGQSDE